MKFKAPITAALLLILGSCQVQNAPDQDPVAPRFNSTITRAIGPQWSSGDEIGVFMTSSDQVSASTILQGADNIAHTVAADGEQGLFAPVNQGQTIFYPNDGSEVTFVAYYPYRTLTNHTMPIDLTNQNDPQSLDIMAAKVGRKSKTDPDVTLVFGRMMSNIMVKISSSIYSQSQMQGVAVKVSGLYTKADLVLLDRTLKNHSAQSDITLHAVDAGQTYQGIILPWAVLTPAATLKFEVAGKTLTYTIPTSGFIAGQRYTYNVELGASSVTSINATITDWKDDPTVNNGTAQ